jgi:transcription antitermination factor NusG
LGLTNASGDSKLWYALQVHSRKEVIVHQQLVGQGYECLLPMFKSIRQWSDRTKELEQPLFPGYLFCRFAFEERRPIVVIPGVQQVVGFGRKATPVDEREIAGLQLAMSSGMPSQPWPFLEVGGHVRVTSGKLAGLEGVLVNFKGKHRVVLSVTLLQRSVALEIDIEAVASAERVNRGARQPVRVPLAVPTLG